MTPNIDKVVRNIVENANLNALGINSTEVELSIINALEELQLKLHTKDDTHEVVVVNPQGQVGKLKTAGVFQGITTQITDVTDTTSTFFKRGITAVVVFDTDDYTQLVTYFYS